MVEATKTGRRKARPMGKRRPTDTLRGVVEVQLADGTVRYRASIPGGRRGARTWTPLLESAEQATELRRRLMKKLEDRPAVAMTFEQAIQATEADLGQRCRPATLAWFKFQVPALREHFGRMLVSSITPEDIERFARRQRASGIAPSTVIHRRRGLRAVLSCVHKQLVNGDPLDKVARGTWPKLRQEKVTAPDPATIREFLTKIIESESERANDRARQDHDIVAALFLSGLRRSELSRLRAEDLLPEKGKIFVQGKNRNEELAVNAEAMAVLQRMSARVDDKGELVPGGVEEIVRVFKTRSERHGINLRAHDLRRAFVTALIRAGHDIATVARYSRHTSDEIRRYMAANEDDKRVLAAVTIEGPAKPAAKKGRVRMRKVE